MKYDTDLSHLTSVFADIIKGRPPAVELYLASSGDWIISKFSAFLDSAALVKLKLLEIMVSTVNNGDFVVNYCPNAFQRVFNIFIFLNTQK